MIPKNNRSPYNAKEQQRAIDSYFHKSPYENQIEKVLERLCLLLFAALFDRPLMMLHHHHHHGHSPSLSLDSFNRVAGVGRVCSTPGTSYYIQEVIL